MSKTQQKYYYWILVIYILYHYLVWSNSKKLVKLCRWINLKRILYINIFVNTQNQKNYTIKAVCNMAALTSTEYMLLIWFSTACKVDPWIPHVSDSSRNALQNIWNDIVKMYYGKIEGFEYLAKSKLVFLVCHTIFCSPSSNPYHLLRARFSVRGPEQIPDRDTKPVPCCKPIEEILHVYWYEFFIEQD